MRSFRRGVFLNVICGPRLCKTVLSCSINRLVNLQTKKVTAFEALMRWEHPERGLCLPPSLFRLRKRWV